MVCACVLLYKGSGVGWSTQAEHSESYKVGGCFIVIKKMERDLKDINGLQKI